MFDHRKKQDPELDTDLADLMLSKVLDQCNANPNTMPLTTLENYSSLKKERYILQKVIIILFLIAWVLLPLAFEVPKISISQTSNSIDSNQPIYQVKVSSIIDVKRVIATIDGENLPVYESKNNVYTVEPMTNGKVLITVTLANRQYQSTAFSVGSVDLSTPTISSHYSDANYLFLTVTDDESGVDFENIKAVQTDGTSVKPVSYDEATGIVKFEYPKDSLNIYIPDKAKNILQTIITVQK